MTYYPGNREGYDGAFQKIFETHRTAVYKQVYAMTHSRWHAEEIVQDVFLRVWVHREKIASIKDIESWLFIITRRFVFDYMRKEIRQRKFYSSYKSSSLTTNGPDSLLLLQ